MAGFRRVDKLERRDLVLVNVWEGNAPIDRSLDRADNLIAVLTASKSIRTELSIAQQAGRGKRKSGMAYYSMPHVNSIPSPSLCS